MNVSLPCLDRYNEDISVLFYIMMAEAIVDFCLVTTVILLNVFIITSILRQWRVCMSTMVASVSCRLVLNLAVCDIFVGIASTYYLSFHYLCKTQDIDRRRLSCLVKLGSNIFSHMASWYSLVAIGIDRYVAVVHALRYSSIMSSRRVMCLILLVWVMAAATALLTVILSPWTPDKPCDEGNVFSVLVFCTLAGSNVALVFTMLLITHWRVHKEALAFTESSPRQPSVKTRSGYTLLLATGCFIFSFVPIITVFFLRVLHSEVFSTPEIAKLVTGLVFTVSKANFIINPFLYAWKNTSIRTAMTSQLKALILWERKVRRRKSAASGGSEDTKCSSLASITSSMSKIMDVPLRYPLPPLQE